MFCIERRCLSEGIVALPVHDSFIVQISNYERTLAIMNEELKRWLSQAQISGKNKKI